MRRRRSETIDAQTYDEFLRLSQTPSLPIKSRARNSLPESSLFSHAIPRRASQLPEIPSTYLNKAKEAAKTVNNTQNYWEDMDFDSEGAKTPATTASSIGSVKSVHKGSMDKAMEEENCMGDSFGNRVNIMVVGARGSGRHQFVNGLFPEDSDGNDDHGIRGAFDLVMKKDGVRGENLYKFWVKDACCEGYKHLFKSYYQTVSVYIFVYQANDRKTFECLDKAIMEIRDAGVNQNAVGFLVAGRSEDGDDNRQVSYEEGELLREKYGLQGFFETSFRSSEEQQRVFSTLFSLRI